jgi:hypothetical protein
LSPSLKRFIEGSTIRNCQKTPVTEMLFSQRETDLRPEEMRFILKLKRILLSRNRFEKKERTHTWYF